MRRTLSRSRFLSAAAAVPAAIAFPNIVRAQGAATIRVGATANDTYAEAYYAQDLGYFKDAGLNVELSTFANGGAVSSALAGGSLDVGITNPVQLATAVGHGLPFVYIAGGGLYSTEAPTTLLCVAKDGPIKNPKDLDGKTIGASQVRDISAVAAQAWLQQHGADLASVKLVEIPFAEMGPALARGTVAAATISEPSLSAAIGKGQARPLGKMFDAIAPHFMISGWFTTSDWVAKNHDAAKRFTEAIYRTAKWANVNQERSGEILSKYSKIPMSVFKSMTRSRYADSLTDAILMPPVELAYKYKLIDKLIPSSQLVAKV